MSEWQPSDLAISARLLEIECPACGGLGVQRTNKPSGHQLFGQLLPCEVCGTGRRQGWLAHVSRLSPEMLSFRLNHFQDRGGMGAVVPALKHALDSGGWVTLSGPPGTGKTFLLACVANAARLAGRIAVYVTVADLLADLRDCFDPKADTNFSALFDSVTRADVLCLDEIEKFRPTPWAEEQFFRLVEHRYRNWNQGLTLLATNKRVELKASILEDTAYPGYLESRIGDGRFALLSQFWNVADARPGMRRPA